MGKPKPRQMMAKPSSKNDTPSDLDSLDDSWVVVKKQRVTILIPPLPHTRKSTTLRPGPSKPEGMPVKTVNDKPTFMVEKFTNMPSIDEPESVTPLVPNWGTQMNTKIPPAPNFSASHKPPSAYVTIQSENPNRVNAFKSHKVQSENQKIFGMSNMSKMIARPRLLSGPGSYLDGHAILNQRLRASLLEKKLQNAGGLSRWLMSLGLGQFARIFRGKGIGKFQLVNLTMKKLKDMGADAVGPRRKLMHAIDCICQPYCFGTQ